MSSPCLIPSNPDVAGIGVRIAIYAQNILCFVPAAWAIWDSEITDYELESVETQSTTNLILAFAILISCIVQAFTLGLTNYHASIVLSMSWTNNTNVFVYFLVYVHYKARGGLGREPIELRWSAWLSHFKMQLRSIVRLTRGAGQIDGECARIETTQKEQGSTEKKGSTGAQILFRRVALLFGSLHLTLMAALGIWLWSEPQAFGKADSVCATEFASLAILGARVSFGSNALRIFSLALYSAFLLPGFNLLLPMLVFLGIFIWHHKYRRIEAPTTLATHQPLPGPSDLPRHTRVSRHVSYLRGTCTRCLQSSAFPVWAGLAFLLAINVVFIADIELTLHRNRDLQASGEAEWGFGQVLAVLLLFMPLRDLVEMIVARRQRRQEEQIKTHEFREAILSRDTTKILAMIDAGGDPNLRTADGHTALEAIILAGRIDLLDTLVAAGAEVNAEFSDGCIPLEMVISSEKNDWFDALVKAGVDMYAEFSNGHTALEQVTLDGKKDWLHALIKAGVDIHADLPDGRTALEVVTHVGNADCLDTLIKAGVDVHKSFSDGRTALEVVARAGNARCLATLIEAGVDINANLSEGHTALEVVARAGRANCLGTLIEAGVDINANLSEGHTALEVVARAGHASCLGTLIEAGVDINANLSDGRTALEVVALAGHYDCLRTLINADVDLEAKFPDGRTALEVACTAGHEDCVEALIKAGVNCQAEFTDGRTALEAVVKAGWWYNLFLLRRRGLNLEAQFSDGRTALEVAAVAGNADCLDQLLNAGVNIETEFSDGRTALEVASSLGHERCFRMLTHVAAGKSIEEFR